MASSLRLLADRFTPKAAIFTVVRWSSSSSNAINDTVKGKLKELYRRVHPDFFHGADEAKAANEKSFKLLQEYLSAADHSHGGGGGGHPNLPYKFNFYLKQQHTEALNKKETTDDDQLPLPLPAETFRKVSLTLPPPNRALPHTTHHALTKLFSACGIEASAAEMTSDGTNTTSNGTIATLSTWIPQVAELYHQSVAANQGGPRQELQAIRTALQLTHRISLSFGGKLATGSVLLQLEAARRLMTILENCPPSVFGLRIGLGDGFGNDPSGTVWLHAEADDATWLEYLQTPDVLDWCHRRKEKQREIRNLESKVATALGIGLILAPDSGVFNSEEYEAFLEKVLDGVSGSNLNLDLKKVCLHVVAAGAASTQQMMIVSDGKGRIIAPISSSITELLSALRRVGPEAQWCAEIASKEEAELKEIKTRVERKLHLRKLLWHPDLPADKFKAGCLRMLQYSATLGPLLDGLPVRLGEVNAFFPGQSQIDIAWSFTP
jgi:hypothetical protein